MNNMSCELKESYMQEALLIASKAFEENEVPIGAVVVDQKGSIIGLGYNKVEQSKTQTAHAEMVALAQAGKNKNGWRLEGCTLFVTLEPCSMCMNAIKLSRIQKVVYGASSPIFGYRLDKDCFLLTGNSDALVVEVGILEQQCSDLLKKFFQKKRMQSE